MNHFHKVVIADKLDLMLGPFLLRCSKERGVLIPLVFHSLYRDVDELRGGAVDPAYATPLSVLEEVVVELKGAGYSFVRPGDLGHDLDEKGRYAVLTLDDGYANQLRAVDVLDRHEVPATFFLATGPIASGESFWWDVLYRNMVRAGADRRTRHLTMAAYQRLEPTSIRDALVEAFGEDALRPWGDFDRPLSISEVQALGATPLVSLGNHTRSHAVLTALSDEKGRREVLLAQDDIQAWAGYRPECFAYPDGVVDARLGMWAQEVGLTCAFSVAPRRSRLPLALPALNVGRFQIDPSRRVDRQLQVLRSTWSIGRAYRSVGRRVRYTRRDQ
jgi:peptidoglycan/xylan/chitin deacetylase (PgdA/CDA1 family)